MRGCSYGFVFGDHPIAVRVDLVEMLANALELADADEVPTSLALGLHLHPIGFVGLTTVFDFGLAEHTIMIGVENRKAFGKRYVHLNRRNAPIAIGVGAVDHPMDALLVLSRIAGGEGGSGG